MRFFLYVILYLSLTPIYDVASETICDFSSNRMAIGEDADFIFCAKDVPTEILLNGLDQADLTLKYSQRLKKCGIDDKRPGFHLVLNSDGKPRMVKLAIENAETNQHVCDIQLSIAARKENIEAEYVIPTDEEKFIDINGINTRYFELGSGQPLLLVHGGNAGGSNNNAMKWSQNIPELSKYFRVIVLDRLAQGETENLKKSDDYKNYFSKDAEHLKGFVETLDLNDVVAVGHSQGGWPVTRLALDKPEVVSCLVNVDTLMVPSDPKLMKKALKFILYVSRHLHPETGPTFYSARRGMALRYPSGNGVSSVKAQSVVDQHFSPKTEEARAFMKANKVSPLSKSFSALKEKAYAEIKAGQLKSKSLVVWGAEDPQVPLGLGKLFQSFLTDNNVDSKMEIISGAGHAPFIEFPTIFNKLLIDYCKN